MALKGVKVMEFLGLAPGPFCGAILADFGASVTVISKIQSSSFDVMSNGKRNISLDLKSKEGTDIITRMCKTTDVLLDTFRPGVMEKLGLGPDILTKHNPRLIYARLSGYGQSGPYKDKAGHDINYVAMSGILSLLAKNKEPPTPPLNLLADFAGGSVLCSLGIILALFERTRSGKGQVIDSGMTDGLFYLSSWILRSQFLPIWAGEPGSNILDGGFAAYKTYKTKDGKFMAVGALEPKFYINFLKGLQLTDDEYPQYSDNDRNEKKFTEIFLQKSQNEWCQVFKNLDACVTPVLEMTNLETNEYYDAKKPMYRDSNNMIIPEPCPKLSRTPGTTMAKKSPTLQGLHTKEVLQELGYSTTEINNFINTGKVFSANKSNL
ncbi:hypothetical protein ACJJTC_011870 [Scirpophaga incertulas]